jgi:transcriptional regulator with XRE-family HTH domain
MATGLGKTVRALRKMRGLTQEQLATACELSRASIANIEVERQNIPINTLQSIANALGYEVHFTFKLKPKE